MVSSGQWQSNSSIFHNMAHIPLLSSIFHNLITRSYKKLNNHRTAGTQTSAVIKSIPPVEGDVVEGSFSAPAWPGSFPGSSHEPLRREEMGRVGAIVVVIRVINRSAKQSMSKKKIGENPVAPTASVYVKRVDPGSLLVPLVVLDEDLPRNIAQ
jgi:hypothetical protein